MTDQDTFDAALDELLAEAWSGLYDVLQVHDPATVERVREMRLVFADWLDERGDPQASAQRWLAREGKFPRPTSAGTWDWWRFGDRADSNPEDLPVSIWSRLPGTAPERMPHCKEYASRRVAEWALFKALLLLGLLSS